METALISPAKAWVLGFIPAMFFSIIIPIIGVACFTYIIAKRTAPLVRAKPDPRLNSIPDRLANMFKFAIGQYRQPRYMMAGVLHIVLFAGFMILSLRSITLVILGLKEGFVLPGLGGAAGHVYSVLKDIAATGVFMACVVGMVRRGIFRPERYDVPKKYGKDHTSEAVFVLLLITTLVTCDMVFEGTQAAAQMQKGLPAEFLLPGMGAWMAAGILSCANLSTLQNLHLGSFFLHNLVFFFFLCFLPMGKHFHVITSIPNVFLMKLKKGTIKPVQWGVDENKLDELKSFGVKKFEDFTWKNMLDFYSCADCGRCSDQCPANAVKRPLSPRFISIKCRDYAFKNYPIRGEMTPKDEPLIGSILSEDEIWSCTTCGACEAECPIFIEYIDKIVDLRRGMVDEGLVPQSLQKPLKAIEKRGNPWGKMEKKRAEWTKTLPETCDVKLFENGDEAKTLYFVDSITSYDDRMQNIARSTACLLSAMGEDFGILGKDEKDSGNEVRRFGEEMLFQDIKSHNTEAILGTGVTKIITADPHAFNTLKNEYTGLPPVEHISQTITRSIKEGSIRLKPVEDATKVYTYHDPCYLGRHNGIYEDPRQALDAVPGLNRVDMLKSRDRSFCCGGGGLMLFYEPEEEQRMGVLRVQMASKAGANVIVTACPFCLVNMEDAIKVAGLEGKMEAIDLCELIERHLQTT
jgi:Fe-S oxidoreductase